MGTGDVLAGLDEIDWAGLEHAYGSAGDVPGLIGALASTEPDEREPLDGHLPADVIDGVLHGLARSQRVAALPMTAAALWLAFPSGAPDPFPAVRLAH